MITLRTTTRALGLAGVFAAALGGAMVHAKGDRVEPEAQARAAVMQEIAGAMKVLGGMAKGEVAFDATAAEAAKAAMTAATARVAVDYATPGKEDPASEVLPVVWENWDDFLARSTALDAAAKGLDVTSLEALTASLGPVGATCKDCHGTYRE